MNLKNILKKKISIRGNLTTKILVGILMKKFGRS